VLKKSLGQHLLKDKNLLEKMVRLAGIGKDDTVIEIGPGQGDLTRCIAARALSVCAVEIDRRFEEVLIPLGRELPNLRVVFSDIMQVGLAGLSEGARVTVMGNIPYYLTGEILFKLLDEKAHVLGAYLTMQKEVAQRIVSPSHNRAYGAISVIFRLYAAAKVLFFIKPGLFIPPPKVESAFISIIFKDMEQADRGLIDFVKRAFRYKRKYLRHCLEGEYAPGDLDALYAHMGFLASVRAEEIEPEGFAEMYRFLTGRRAA
jgi:16S rRNA (adenine1518-N6/adenine1519-N6)-dimethyltransferase